MLEMLGRPTVLTLILSACLCLFGLVTLFYMFVLGLLHRGPQSRIWKIVAIFGAIGLLVPAAVLPTSLLNNDIGKALARLLWPTYFVLGAGESGDPVVYIIVVFGAAVLSNVGLYGVLGLLVGAVWMRIQARRAASLGEQ